MQFKPGQTFEFDGIKYQILRGNRCPGDMVIEFSLDGNQWCRPPIAHPHILLNFKYQVEENNYRDRKKGLGGSYLVDRTKQAMKEGWEIVARETRKHTDAIRNASGRQGNLPL